VTPATCCSKCQPSMLFCRNFDLKTSRSWPRLRSLPHYCDIFTGHRIIRILNSAQTDHLSHISKAPSIIALRMYRDSPKKFQTMRSAVFVCFWMRRRAIEVHLFRVIPNYSEFTPFSKVKFPSIKFFGCTFLHNC
jgi:hypothetical protein